MFWVALAVILDLCLVSTVDVNFLAKTNQRQAERWTTKCTSIIATTCLETKMSNAKHSILKLYVYPIGTAMLLNETS